MPSEVKVEGGLRISIGKRVRLARILGRGDGRAFIYAFDHGFEHGPRDFPREHLDPRVVMKKVVKAGVDAVMMTSGIAKATWDIWCNRTALILKVTGKTSLRPESDQLLQSRIGGVAEAVALGADAVAATVYWGSPYEDVMLENFVSLSQECDYYGMPILQLAYPRGPSIPNMYDVEIVRYAARAASELGADLIKTYYTGSKETFAEVVRSATVPVLMSGGPKVDDPRDFLKVVRSVMDAGAAGVVVGRNVFQSENPEGMAKAIMKIVHKGLSVEDAIKFI